MEREKTVREIKKIVDEEATTTVGILCKRIENLEENKAFEPKLYKEIAKEVVYEQSRVLKKLLGMLFIPNITFKSREK